jgi:hypothetical protein
MIRVIRVSLQAPKKTPRRLRRSVKSGFGAVAVAIIFLPVVFGPFEGWTEIKTNTSQVSVEPRFSFAYLGDLASWLGDRVTLKDQAIRVDSKIDRAIFNESATAGSVSPRVLEGEGGVAFIADAFNESCNPHIQTDGLVRQMTSLSRVIVDSGRDFRLIVSPDKSSILADYLPNTFNLKNCFETYNEDFWNQLSSGDISGFVDLRSESNAQRISRREILYKKRDTHWDNAGGAMASKAVVNSISPGLWEEDLLKFSELYSEGGDLDLLLGSPFIDSVPSYSLTRADVSQVSSEAIDQSDHGQNRRVINTSTDSFLIPGRTLIFGDSFSEAAQPFFLSYFADVTLMRLDNFSLDKYVDLIREADRVLFWSVERSFPYRVAYDWGTENFLNALANALK